MTIVDRILADVRKQPNTYSCGPAALRHALLCKGARHDVRKLARWAKTTDVGTDDQGLQEASLRAGFKLKHISFECAPLAKAALYNWLHVDVPVICCVDRWDHWITAIHATKRRVTICDSGGPAPVIQSLTWRQFLSRLCMWKAPGEMSFDLYPLFTNA